MKEKRQLIRVVRTDTQDYSLDFTGKKAGRGAYVCPDLACLERAYKQKGLERSFAAGRKPQSEQTASPTVPPEIYEALRATLTERLGSC
jgi:hypothetical protein